MACAGDQLIYEVTLTDLRSEGAVVDAKAFLNGELLADAEIVFAHLDNSRANQIFGPKNFVFTQQLLGVLDLAKAQQRARGRSEADGGAESNGQAHEIDVGHMNPLHGSVTRGRIRRDCRNGCRWMSWRKICALRRVYAARSPFASNNKRRFDSSEHLRT